MTIWQILIYWLISEVLAWGIWWIIIKKMVVWKLDADHEQKMNCEMDRYPRTQSGLLEWLRFIIWPYGIIQRTVMLMKLRKKVIDEN